ncbi:hypothetical protein IX317_002125 [Fusobacterium sp. DD29]|uniref:hypothetical protein n=1 Tax=unclassified Fusobacterium TaxID=2648384 RepID=UPI001DBE5454|nr:MULTISPECIES: hypothetical protein [unclassified Fusobacterium]MBR8701480.1 hypothetical protein [Fusobacterium sp. DD45]MBR8711952.1 hypothetical protein [Fusobacterium sp. DD28]MBR8750403.1 hypothetical protein [Fusobacterium sp. DD29]MBR8752525.1 hypothetical protein [Fusobacterium sp. DD26]MBR8762642.1 hypothetical protein [Fusobacterium sp. DD25]
MSDYSKFKDEYEKKSKKTEEKKNTVKKIKTKGKTDSRKIAKKILKESLKQEYSIELTVDGDTSYCAGAIIELDESFGKFQGRYIIDQVIHQVDGDYSCQIVAFKIGARENAERKAKEKDAKKSKETKKKEKKEWNGKGSYMEWKEMNK